jgi:hypothetical protein
MRRTTIAVLVIVHLLVTLWHGGAHTDLAITLPPEKNAFVYLVILLGPLVALGLVWTRWVRAGVWLFFLSMLGAFVFGAYHHYVLVSPDNIHHLPEGAIALQARFIDSAAALAIIELVSALYGAFCLGVMRSQASTRT